MLSVTQTRGKSLEDTCHNVALLSRYDNQYRCDYLLSENTCLCGHDSSVCRTHTVPLISQIPGRILDTFPLPYCAGTRHIGPCPRDTWRDHCSRSQCHTWLLSSQGHTDTCSQEHDTCPSPNMRGDTSWSTDGHCPDILADSDIHMISGYSRKWHLDGTCQFLANTRLCLDT